MSSYGRMSTEREKNQRQIVEYALRGHEVAEIAKHLGVLPATVTRILKIKGLTEVARTARETAAYLPTLPPSRRSDVDAFRLVKQSIRTVGIEDVLDDLEDSGVHVMLVHAFLRWLRSPEAERYAINLGLASAVLGQKTINRLLGLSPLEIRAAWTVAGEPPPISYQPDDPVWWLRYALRFGTYVAMDLFDEKLNAGERQRLRRSHKYKGVKNDDGESTASEASAAREPVGGGA